MQTVQQIAAKAFASQPTIYLHSEAEAEAFIAPLNEEADPGEAYVFHAYQGGRFVVALTFNGETEVYL